LTAAVLVLSACSSVSREERFQRDCEEFTLTYCPQRKDSCQTLDSITYRAEDNSMHNWYALNGMLDCDTLFSEKLRDMLHDELLGNLKKSLQLKKYKDAGVTFVYHYRSATSGKELHQVAIGKESY
jgi:hypothetical protein